MDRQLQSACRVHMTNQFPIQIRSLWDNLRYKYPFLSVSTIRWLLEPSEFFGSKIERKKMKRTLPNVGRTIDQKKRVCLQSEKRTLPARRRCYHLFTNVPLSHLKELLVCDDLSFAYNGDIASGPKSEKSGWLANITGQCPRHEACGWMREARGWPRV